MDEYTIRTVTIPGREPDPPSRIKYWDKLRVEVVRGLEGQKVGEYHRNYPDIFHTFCPFELRGKELALYSPNYTGTRLMELPSCKDLGGEEPDPAGFCPTDYLVPPGAEFGFVAGCQWGDDFSWKIQFLDLSRADEGILRRDERFGYIEIKMDRTLADSVRVFKEPWMFPERESWVYEEGEPEPPEWTVEMDLLHRFRIDTGEFVDKGPWKPGANT